MAAGCRSLAKSGLPAGVTDFRVTAVPPGPAVPRRTSKKTRVDLILEAGPLTICKIVIEMFAVLLPLVQTLLPAFILISSIYYQKCPVTYRVPLRKDQRVDYLTQPLKKYAFPHIGFKPELAPTRSRAGWHGRAPFIARDGKTILQEYFSFPYNANSQVPFTPLKPSALCIIFPGLGDSVERVAVFADELARYCRNLFYSLFMEDDTLWPSRAGFAVHGMDYPGFGRSQRDSRSGSSCTPCIVKDWEDGIVAEMMQFISSVRQRAANQGLPCFLVGNSIGGATALRCAMLGGPDLFTGAVLLCPAIKSDARPILQVPLRGRG